MSRYFFVVDADNTRVGAFDISNGWRQEQIATRVPDDLSIESVRLPTDGGGNTDPLQILSDTVIKPDERIVGI